MNEVRGQPETIDCPERRADVAGLLELVSSLRGLCIIIIIIIYGSLFFCLLRSIKRRS